MYEMKSASVMSLGSVVRGCSSLDEAMVRIEARIGRAVVRVCVECERKECRKARCVVS